MYWNCIIMLLYVDASLASEGPDLQLIKRYTNIIDIEIQKCTKLHVT